MAKELENILKLKKDFLSRHSGIDYLTQKEIFQYIDMAYCLGVDDSQIRNTKPVIRSDGEIYLSISSAAKKNKVGDRSIRKALKNNTKSAGYFWKYG